jgi:hypothetical protein
VPSRARGRVFRFALLGLAVILLVGAVPTLPPARATTYPVVPLGSDRWFVSNLTGAEVTPGAGGSLGLSVGNPLAGITLTAIVLTLDVYAFNAFPGNATSTVGVATAPILSNGSSSGPSVNLSLGSLAPGGTLPETISVATSATTPSGTFAVRTALRFLAGGEAYLFESRGWFTDAQWAAATTVVNGSVGLNVTALGVSGVAPETSILVTNSDLSTALWAVFGAGVVLVGVAAWLYFRPPKSSSGARKVPADIQAPSAFGSNRTSDGD